MRERIQKIIAAAGVTSRRGAEELIREGKVTLNGQTVKDLGARADPCRDHVKVNGKVVKRESLRHYVVNKPQGVLSSAADPRKRPLVTDLVNVSKRLYPAGRLDYQSEGLVILTNDGELTQKITRSGGIKKVYRVKVRGRAPEKQLDKLCRGARIQGEKFSACEISLLKEARNCWYEVILCEGKNRQIRRMFGQIGHPVMRLRRTAIGSVRLGELAPGAHRKMTPEEVSSLKASN